MRIGRIVRAKKTKCASVSLWDHNAGHIHLYCSSMHTMSLHIGTTITKNLIAVIVDYFCRFCFHFYLCFLLLSLSSSWSSHQLSCVFMYFKIYTCDSIGMEYSIEFSALFENLVIVELSHKQHECRQHLFWTFFICHSNFGMKIIFRTITK